MTTEKPSAQLNLEQFQNLVTQFQSFAKAVDAALEPHKAQFEAIAKAVGAEVEQQKAKYAPLLQSFAELTQTEQFQRMARNLEAFNEANKNPIYVPPRR